MFAAANTSGLTPWRDLRRELVGAGELESHASAVERLPYAVKRVASATTPPRPIEARRRRRRRSPQPPHAARRRRAGSPPAARRHRASSPQSPRVRPSPRSPSPPPSPATPGASPSSSTESRVIAAVTQERPGLDLDQRHHAVDLDRAHDAGEAVARRQRGRRSRGGAGGALQALDLRGAARAGGCARRATVRSLPARSQRRSVSALTPSARRRLADRQRRRHLPKHCIGSRPRRDMPPPMRVFVAGATGVIGRPLVRLLLDAGHEVSAIARSEEAARRCGATAQARRWRTCSTTSSCAARWR